MRPVQHIHAVDLKEPEAIERPSQTVRGWPRGTRNAEPLRSKDNASRLFE
jgi:hypothetical protein